MAIPIIYDINAKSHRPMKTDGSEVLSVNTINISHDDSMVGNGQTGNGLGISSTWVTEFVDGIICDIGGECFRHTTLAGITENVYPYREGYYMVTVGDRTQLIILDTCDSYHVGPDTNGNTVFSFKNGVITGTGAVTVELIWLSKTENKTLIYQGETNVSYPIYPNAPDDYHLVHYLSNYEDMAHTPAWINMWSVGTYTLQPGSYYFTGYGDDQTEFYINSSSLGGGGGSGSWFKIPYTVTVTTDIIMMVRNENVVEDTPSWFQISLLNADGTLNHAMDKNDFHYGLVTPLNCVKQE